MYGIQRGINLKKNELFPFVSAQGYFLEFDFDFQALFSVFWLQLGLQLLTLWPLNP